MAFEIFSRDPRLSFNRQADDLLGGAVDLSWDSNLVPRGVCLSSILRLCHLKLGYCRSDCQRLNGQATKGENHGLLLRAPSIGGRLSGRALGRPQGGHESYRVPVSWAGCNLSTTRRISHSMRRSKNWMPQWINLKINKESPTQISPTLLPTSEP